MRKLQTILCFATLPLLSHCGSSGEGSGFEQLPPPQATNVCGNNRADANEVCDGIDLRSQTCEQLGLGTGTLACADDCTALNKDDCAGPPTCGNGALDPGEICDPSTGAMLACDSLGLGDGTIPCKPNCSEWDPSNCSANNPECGNNIAEGDEPCDGLDLRNSSCQTLGFTSGTLLCAPDCSGFNSSNCRDDPPECGNNIAEGNEPCDGLDLRNSSCQTLGFTSGTLLCAPDCSGFNSSNCQGDQPECGDGVREEQEACDGNDFGGLTCNTLGFDRGDLVCVGCTQINTDNCENDCVGAGCDPLEDPEITISYDGYSGPQDTDCQEGVCTIPAEHALEFPQVLVSGMSSAQLLIHNNTACVTATTCSDCALEVTSVTVDFGSNYLVIAPEESLPATLSRANAACGQDGTLLVDLLFQAPMIAGNFSATLTIASNDPERAIIEVPMTISVVSVPVAVPDFRAYDPYSPNDPWTDPNNLSAQTRLYFDGSESYDPRDTGNPALITGYSWSVITYPGFVPPGDLDPTGASTPLFSFYAPTEGIYVVELVVYNESGVASAPAELRFSVGQPFGDSELRIELTWDQDIVDMDLHLVNMELGGLVCNTDDDCFWQSRTPIWFIASSAGTGPNPFLDIDDTYGYGPEITVIDEALPGTYRIFVHYFAAQPLLSAPITANSIAVSFGGEVIANVHRSLVNEKDIWAVGDIEITATGATFVPYPSDAAGQVGAVKTMMECSEPGFDFESGSTGSGCQDNSDCDIGLVCDWLTGYCMNCSSDTQCDSGYICSPDGLCVATECSIDTDCDAGICVGGACITPVGDPCTTATDCPHFGYGGACLDETEGFKDGYCTVQNCVNDADCDRGGHCGYGGGVVYGYCVRTCQSDLQCRGDGYLCFDGDNDGLKECMPAATGTGRIGGACSQTWECGGGVDGYCMQEWPNGYCTFDCGPTSWCPENTACIASIDLFTGFTGFRCQNVCEDSSDCRSGYLCDVSPLDLLGRKTCMPPLP